MTADLVFAPEPEPELEPARIDWAHRPADDELARIIDDAASEGHDS